MSIMKQVWILLFFPPSVNICGRSVHVFSREVGGACHISVISYQFPTEVHISNQWCTVAFVCLFMITFVFQSYLIYVCICSGLRLCALLFVIVWVFVHPYVRVLVLGNLFWQSYLMELFGSPI